MRLLISAIMLFGIVSNGIVFADENKPGFVETGFNRYVVNPSQFAHRFTWGVLTMAYKIGKTPIDAGFKLVGQTIGTEPNTPLWE